MRRFCTVLILLFGLIIMPSCSGIQKVSIPIIDSSASEPAVTASSSNDISIPVISIKQEPDENGSDGVIRIAFGGDTFIDMVFAEYSDLYGVDYAWSDISPIFQNSHISFVNLETSVSTGGQSTKREGYGFRTLPDKLEGYKNAGINIVSCANNHVGDFGIQALEDTMRHLDTYGIACSGIASCLDDVRKPVFFECEGIKVGFLSYCEIIPDKSWTATAQSPGFAGITEETLELYLEDIEKYDSQCDILVVSVHWGIEHTQEITASQKELAHQLIDCGADMILGHHPHVLQPVEFYKQKPVFYSLGNLLFLKQDDFAGQTAVFRAEFDKNGFLCAKMFPVNISGCKANILPESSILFNNILANMAEISAPFGTGISKYGEITPYLCDDPPLYIEVFNDSSQNDDSELFVTEAE